MKEGGYFLSMKAVESDAELDEAKKAIATGASVREVLRTTGLFTDEEIEKILDPETMV